jgi:hypothetical protein
MPRYRLLEPWPINGGACLVPAGTILDGNDLQWNGIPLPSALPLCAMPLDPQAYREMKRQHPQLTHLIHRPHGSDFEEYREFDEMIARRLAC